MHNFLQCLEFSARALLASLLLIESGTLNATSLPVASATRIDRAFRKNEKMRSYVFAAVTTICMGDCDKVHILRQC